MKHEDRLALLILRTRSRLKASYQSNDIIEVDNESLTQNGEVVTEYRNPGNVHSTLNQKINFDCYNDLNWSPAVNTKDFGAEKQKF